MKEDCKIKSERYFYDLVRKNIRKYRTFSNITQEELAEMVDFNWLC